MSLYGEVECIECDRRFESSITAHSYSIEGYTKTDYCADPERCDFCNGGSVCCEDDCSKQATVYNKDSGFDYCAACWKKSCDENDETEEECEGLVVRLETRFVLPV